MEKNKYSTLKIEESTATQLKAFARKWNTTQSKSLQLMLDFFKKHALSPSEDLRPNMKSFENRLGQRIEFLTAILRNIERTQIRPTHAMLQLLLQAQPSTKKEILVEKQLYQGTEQSPTETSHKAYDRPPDDQDQEALIDAQPDLRENPNHP